MPFLSRAVSLADEGSLRKLTFLRLMVATLVVGAAIVVLQIGGEAGSIGILYGLLGAIYLSTASVYFAFRAGAPFGVLTWLEIVLDCVVITMILHYSGGSASYFAVLYVLPILLGAVYFQVSGGLGTAVIATASYVTYSILEAGGYVMPVTYSAAAPMASVSAGAPQVLPLHDRVRSHGAHGRLPFGLCAHARGELDAKDQELKRAQLHADSIITNVSSGLIVTNMAGEILTCNPAAIKILGLAPAGSYTGALVQDVIPHMSALVLELEGALSTGSPRRRHELEVRRKDGTELPLGISISLIKGESGEKRGVVAIFQDLTEVHLMREKVRRADKMAAIGELSTAIAHEIRAPLASICGSVEMLAGELTLSGDNRKLMDLVIKESDRLDRIITDFLEFARLKRPAFEPVDVEACLDEVLLLLRHSNDFNKGISIDVKGGAPHACVYADDEQIRQVFLNLIMNACEAMAEGGRLTIRIDGVIKALRDGGCPEECVAIDSRTRVPRYRRRSFRIYSSPSTPRRKGGRGSGWRSSRASSRAHFRARPGHERPLRAVRCSRSFSRSTRERERSPKRRSRKSSSVSNMSAFKGVQFGGNATWPQRRSWSSTTSRAWPSSWASCCGRKATRSRP